MYDQMESNSGGVNTYYDIDYIQKDHDSDTKKSFNENRKGSVESHHGEAELTNTQATENIQKYYWGRGKDRFKWSKNTEVKKVQG